MVSRILKIIFRRFRAVTLTRAERMVGLSSLQLALGTNGTIVKVRGSAANRLCSGCVPIEKLPDSAGNARRLAARWDIGTVITEFVRMAARSWNWILTIGSNDRSPIVVENMLRLMQRYRWFALYSCDRVADTGDDNRSH